MEYVDLIKSGDPHPLKTMAEKRPVDKSRASRWVSKARNLGYIDALVLHEALRGNAAIVERLAPKEAIALKYEDPADGRWIDERNLVVDGVTPDGGVMLRFAEVAERPCRWITDPHQLRELRGVDRALIAWERTTAAAHHVTVSAASRRVKEARRRGYLPEGQQGQITATPMSDQGGHHV
jgi:hypothetical protein